MKKAALLILVISCSLIHLPANARVMHSINRSWRFIQGNHPAATEKETDDSGWESVNFPHTWNALDAVDDIPGYYRDISWYRRSIFIPEEHIQKQVTIFFEGANQEVELFINGRPAGSHAGGYTRFSFDITDLLVFGEYNTFAIQVNNRHNPDIPPLSADFTFFGGIYRDVYLIYTEKQHISTTHYASPGIYISTPSVNENQAEVHIKTILTNAENKPRKVTVEHTVADPAKRTILTVKKQVALPHGINALEDTQQFRLENPSLWSPESPELYTVYTRLYDAKSNALLDEVMQPLGIRWFEFSTDKGFMLNGKPYKLIGTSRHQCYDRIGNALPDEMHIRDVMLLKNMGGNFLRVSHYPQDPTVMEMCDKLGIITSVEIPVINAITENKAFADHCLYMAREMVLQDYNRPSVVIWAYMNEILLRNPYKEDPAGKETYFKEVHTLAVEIENQIRKDDPYRYTLIPFHGNFHDYHTAGLTAVPMLIGWNLYQGWYGDSFEKFDAFLDNAQEQLPGIPFMITEYGADADPRLHSFEPVRFDYTAEYANLYHEHYIRAIMERSFVVGATIWNLNDFHSEERTNAMPHINNKGITSVNREVKDTYLHYQAMLTKEPVVLIGGSNWKIRGGNEDRNGTCVQPVKVYSNLKEVELIVNSVSLGKKEVKDYIVEFHVPFVHGKNTLEAAGYNKDGKRIRDVVKTDFRLIPADLRNPVRPFEEINVMFGSKRYFEDKEKSMIWLPEKEYTPGSWGYVGGSPYVKRTRHGQQPASDLDIWGTTDDPVFQTMRRGIELFKMDVPDGQYAVSFYWAELQGETESRQLAYNLGNDALREDFSERVFDVSINDIPILSGLNIAEQYGFQRAVEKKFIVNTKDNEGITIAFSPKKGEPILNAIRIYRIY